MTIVQRNLINQEDTKTRLKTPLLVSLASELYNPP